MVLHCSDHLVCPRADLLMVLHCSDYLSCPRADLLIILRCSDLGKKHGRLPLSSTSKWLRILHTELPLDGPPQGLLLEFSLLFWGFFGGFLRFFH